MTAPVQEVNPFAAVDFSDHRGGVFFIVGSRRVHEDDLTAADKDALAAQDAARAAAIEQAAAPVAPTSPSPVTTSA